MKINLCLIFILFMLLAGCSSSPYGKLQYLDIKDIDFKTLNPGKYKGSYSYSTYEWEVEATVKNGKVTDIKILKSQNTYHGIKAREVLKRVIDEQSLQVDCVTGATNSSKGLLKTTENALEKAE